MATDGETREVFCIPGIHHRVGVELATVLFFCVGNFSLRIVFALLGWKIARSLRFDLVAVKYKG
jgi:hypothetical protein